MSRKWVTTDMRPSRDPWALADTMGATIGTHEGGPAGLYWGHGHITLRAGLGPLAARCTLAHELGHMAHGDHPHATGHTHRVQERRAWQFAANLLIAPAAYADAETLHGPHPGAIAAELGVTLWTLAVWRDMHGVPTDGVDLRRGVIAH